MSTMLGFSLFGAAMAVICFIAYLNSGKRPKAFSKNMMNHIETVCGPSQIPKDSNYLVFAGIFFALFLYSISFELGVLVDPQR